MVIISQWNRKRSSVGLAKYQRLSCARLGRIERRCATSVTADHWSIIFDL